MVLGAVLTGCASSPPAPQAVLPMKELMAHVVDPAADAFWHASGTIVTAEGEESRAPVTQEGWDAAENAAATLAEAGALLQLPGRARDQGDWLRLARQLTRESLDGMKAAEAKDEAAVFDTGGRIYVVCRSCHLKYIPGFQ
jgi:hypothetical protein